MATRTTPDDHERAAAGQDFDENNPMNDRASEYGSRIAEEGPGALFEELENLMPEAWRDQIRTYPIAALLLGLGVGVWLGMKKSDEIIAAGSSLVSAAAMANVGQVMDRFKQ